MNIPEGYVLVPVDSIKAIDMGWAYLDAARESEPEKSHSFSHAGYRAMIEAAPTVKFPDYDEAKERDLFIAEFKLEGKIYYDENTKQWLPTSDTIKGFQMAERTLGCWLGWSACAKSRARSAE